MSRRRPPADVAMPLAALAVSVALVAAAQGVAAIAVSAAGSGGWTRQAVGGGVLSLAAVLVLLLAWLRLPEVVPAAVPRMLRFAVVLTAAGFVLNGAAALLALF